MSCICWTLELLFVHCSSWFKPSILLWEISLLIPISSHDSQWGYCESFHIFSTFWALYPLDSFPQYRTSPNRRCNSSSVAPAKTSCLSDIHSSAAHDPLSQVACWFSNITSPTSQLSSYRVGHVLYKDRKKVDPACICFLESIADSRVSLGGVNAKCQENVCWHVACKWHVKPLLYNDCLYKIAVNQI